MQVAGWTGLEPAASGVTGRRSNQLNYHPKGNFDGLRKFKVQSDICVTSLRSHFTLRDAKAGGRYRTRTCDSRRVKPVLYQLS